MIKPIYLYGQRVLRSVCKEIQKEDKSIKKLIEDLFDTVKNAQGIGLAAPQIGVSLAIFVVDTTEIEEGEGVKKVFINPDMIEMLGKEWGYKEGCLSIPGIRESVHRPPDLKLKYLDENFNPHTEHFSGMMARIIQHEYDHLKGILFTDKLVGLKKTLSKKKLKRVFDRKEIPNYPFT